jgi:hypothetical protein
MAGDGLAFRFPTAICFWLVSLPPASLVAVAKRLCVLCSRSSGRRRALFGDLTAADVDAGATGAVLAIGSARKREVFAEQECLSLRGFCEVADGATLGNAIGLVGVIVVLPT